MSYAPHVRFPKLLNFGAGSARGLAEFGSNLRCGCSFRNIRMENNHGADSRSALIVLEGLDRRGKSSHSSRLKSYLQGLGVRLNCGGFQTGALVSLKETMLSTGNTLIVDRCSYSGVAFSSAKGLDIEWCKAPEVGLLAPDPVVYLDILLEKAAERGGYGGETYEQLDFQRKVAHYYQVLHDPSCKIIDANLPIEDIEILLCDMVLDCVKTCQNGEPLLKLW